MRNKKFHMDIDVLFAGSSVYMGFHLLGGKGGGARPPKIFDFGQDFRVALFGVFFSVFPIILPLLRLLWLF